MRLIVYIAKAPDFPSRKPKFLVAFAGQAPTLQAAEAAIHSSLRSLEAGNMMADRIRHATPETREKQRIAAIARHERERGEAA